MKKKILIIPSWYVSEEWPRNGIFFKEQAEAFAHHSNYDVSVVAPLYRSLKFLPKRVRGKEGTYVANKVKTYFKEFYYLKYFDAVNISNFTRAGKYLIKQYIKDNGYPDIIHFQSAVNSFKLAEYVYESLKIPYIVTEHSTYFVSGEKFDISKLLKCFKHASKLYAVSNGLCKNLENKTNYKWSFLPNFIDENYFKPTNGVKNEKFTIGTLSILEKKKAVDNLLRAFAKLELRDKMELIIGGDGIERSNLEELSIKLGLQRNVRFIGALDRSEVLATMTNLDVFVLPSSYETFGVVLIEAMALGKPVIATKCVGPESIISQECGILCEVDNSNSLAQAIKEIHANFDKYEKDEIRRFFLENFSSKAVCEKLKLTYDTVIDNHG